ncbi:helix-turn-helix domain-containing protein [Xylanibacter muris]|uniref:helix-turn-helix domain-containing protein n=1 Tax=Xylanibacter muris TaxID=2736290 RepID=UPI002557E4A9|nr:XRE family transcriptional regulator [Xylanibacter muris]
MENLNFLKIKIARKSQRLSMDDLVSRMGDRAISKNSISKIERGLLRPSVQTLSAIADACNVPLSYFYDDDMRIGKLDFRFTKDIPTKKAEQIKCLVISEIQKYLLAENIVCSESDNLKLSRRKLIRTYDDAENVTIDLRKKLEIGYQPIFSVYELFMNCGIHIIEVDIEDYDILGLSTFVCDSIPVIIINRNTNKTTERKRFTALHELAHLILNIRLLSDNDDCAEMDKYKKLPYKVTVKKATSERICHHFAAAMLIPQNCLFKRVGHIRTKLSLEELVSIRNMYGISIAAIIHRCHDLAIIDDKEYNNLFDNLINKNIMETGWGGYPIMEKADRLKLLEERIKLECINLNRI